MKETRHQADRYMAIRNVLSVNSGSFSLGKKGHTPICQGVILQHSCLDLEVGSIPDREAV